MRKSKTTPVLLALVMAVCTNMAVLPATAFAAEAEAVIENEAESTEEEKISVQDEQDVEESETDAVVEETKEPVGTEESTANRTSEAPAVENENEEPAVENENEEPAAEQATELLAAANMSEESTAMPAASPAAAKLSVATAKAESAEAPVSAEPAASPAAAKLTAATAKEEPAAASASEEHHLAFASDYHNTEGSIQNAMEGMPEDVEYVSLIGDMVGDRGGSHPEYESERILDLVQEVFPELDNESVSIVWADHDASVNDDGTGIVKCMDGVSELIREGINKDNTPAYYIYGIGFYDMKKGNSTSAEAASVFKKWVNQVNHTIPVIVLCHMPIQASRGDNNGASYWNEALNYAATGVEGITTTDVSADITRNVLFLHGHNHTNDPVEHYFGAGTTLSVQVDKSSEQSNEPKPTGDSAHPSGGTQRPPHRKAEGILSNIYYTYLTAGYLKTSGNATLVSIVDGALNLTKFNGGQTVSLGNDGVTSDPMGESLTIAAQRHHEGEALEQNITGATCEHGGAYDVVICCSVCGEELHRTHIETEALGHSWGEWTVARKATQTAEGEKVRTCSECGKKETRPIPKLEAEKTSEPASSEEAKDSGVGEQTKEAETESPRTAASPRTADREQWPIWLVIMCLAMQAAVVVRVRRDPWKKIHAEPMP